MNFGRSSENAKENMDATDIKETKVNKIFEQVVTSGKGGELKNDHTPLSSI